MMRHPWFAFRSRPPCGFRPQLELLEDRLTPRVFVVNSLADGMPMMDGQLTLREAITAATTNLGSGDALAGEASDEITFATSLTGGTINLEASQGQLNLDAGGDLTIVGPGGGASGITISGQNAIRVFNIADPVGMVTLQDLTITQGEVVADSGGGLFNSGMSTILRNVVVINNSGDNGGGIENTGTLTVELSRVVGNVAGFTGGGIHNGNGTLTVSGSTIDGNQANDGGGIANDGQAGMVTIRGSTISNNSSGFDVDGAAGVQSDAGTLRVFNSTIALNRAGAGGVGGALLFGGTGTIVHTTIFGNSTEPGEVSLAAGVENVEATLTLANSIVAGNVGGDGNTDGTIDINNDNFIDGDPGLGALQNNGGPTLTLAPLPGSPVLDAGTNTFATETGQAGGTALPLDQRGFSRAVGTVDQGAVEVFAPGTMAALQVFQKGVDANTVSSALPVNLVALITGNASLPPEGTVVFFDGNTQLNSVPLLVDMGTATLPEVTLAEGVHNLRVLYTPASFAFHPASVTEAVTAEAPTSTTVVVPSSDMVLTTDSVTFTATVTSGGVNAPDPEGSVDFLLGGTPLNASPVGLDASNQATFTVNGLPAGSNTITARFNPAPDSSLPTSEGSTEVTATEPPPPPPPAAPFPSTTIVTASTNSTSTALPVSFVATVTVAGTDAPDPQGTVDFFLNGRQLNSVPLPLQLGNQAVLPVAGLPEGVNTITARFTPSTSNVTGSEGETEVSARLTDTIGVVGPGTDSFFLRNQNNAGVPDHSFPFGLPSYLPVVGNWTGADEEIDLPGMVSPDGGVLTWFLSDDLIPFLPNLPAFAYGLQGWLPLGGDWDGNGGPDGIGVYDPLTSIFYLRTTPDGGAPQFTISFGVGGSGMLPVTGDWNGDGVDTVGLYNPATGEWFLRASNDPNNPNLVAPFAYGGGPGTVPIVGDWDGDGDDTVGIFAPEVSTGFGLFFLRNDNSPGAPDVNGGQPFPYGLQGWTPVSGNWGPRQPALFPLQAAEGAGSGGAVLEQGQLDFIVSAALDDLLDAGVDPAVVQALARVEYKVGPLPEGWLGGADVAGGRVIVDDDAAGHGWFVDETPGEDGEFSGEVEGVDLLTVVLHEVGHLLGWGDDSGPDLMQGLLPEGERRLDALDALFAS